MRRHYVLAAGGTGGHIIPAYALGLELIARGHRVALVTDARGMAIPGRPEALELNVLPAGRAAGRNPLGWARAGLAILRGRAQAVRLLTELEPAAVVGFGGYPALPALMAATAAKIPVVIHEQNAVLGRVNRWFARQVAVIATSCKAVDRLPSDCAGKVALVGNPVRAEVLALRERPFPAPAGAAPLRVLVTGGSQGARILSEVVPDGLALLPKALRARLAVTQQCRPEDIAGVRERYAAHGIAAELATYFEDMAARLADAHLFVGRAGASTIAELTAVGRPAVLVPLAIATDDHQAANTREIAGAGGAVAIRQGAFTPEALAAAVTQLTDPPEALAAAAHAAWRCGYPDAARDLADLVESFGAAPMMDVIRVKPAAPAVAGEALAREGTVARGLRQAQAERRKVSGYGKGRMTSYLSAHPKPADPKSTHLKPANPKPAQPELVEGHAPAALHTPARARP